MERHLPPAPLQANGPDEYRFGMEFKVLGPLEVSENGETYALGGPKQRAVLALLIEHAGRSVSTGSLIEGVYGDDSPQGARRSIQTYVSNLRGAIGDVIHGTSDGYQLAVERDQVDAYQFENAMALAKDETAVRASAVLREALALWRGHPYSDVDAGDAVDSEIRRLSSLRVQALEDRIDADLTSGLHKDLIPELESLATEFPLRERFTEQLMLALYRSGRQADALRAYERARSYLISETGLDPSAELRQLEQRILEQDTTLDLETRSSVRRAAVMVTDLGHPPSIALLPLSDRADLLDRQMSSITESANRNNGDLFATSGAAAYLTFPDVKAAATAAGEIQHRLDGIELPAHRLRIAIDVGDIETGETVTGPPVSRAAAVVAAAHGGQVLLSSTAQQELSNTTDGGWVVRSLGSQTFRSLDQPETIHQLVIDDEFKRGGLRRAHLAVGMWVLPTLIAHGTEAQQERFAARTKMREQAQKQFETVKTAANELTAKLTDAQKAKAQQVLPGLAFGPGMARAGGPGWHHHWR